MRVNERTVLVGERVVLVPYSVSHVPKYHEWMTSAELRELTASEALSLEEEYDMQQKWQLDEDKLTFIILARPTFSAISSSTVPTDPAVSALSMIGDVNIFLKGTSPRLRAQTEKAGKLKSTSDEDEEEDFEAEVEIMIAEPAYRRKGLASEALRLMLCYATGHHFSVGQHVLPQSDDGPGRTLPATTLSSPPSHSRSVPALVAESYQSPLPFPPTSLVTRISRTNTPSIRLFEKLGFGITKVVTVFDEVEMRYGAHADNPHT